MPDSWATRAMVFKRRNKLSLGRRLIAVLWPRGGWKRAATYVMHRVRRLPDTPEKIARGVAFGIFVSFTPLFGLHFVLATILSLLFRGNVVAALLATFVGNPVTFPIIGTVALELGHAILGRNHVPAPAMNQSVISLFSQATGDLWHNLLALFTPEVVNWTHLIEFADQVFLPYLVGGILPGAIAALTGYYLSKPVIAAYQNHRRRRLMARWKERQNRASKGADDSS